MNNEKFKTTKNVIKDFFTSLQRDTVREWAITSGRFLNQNKKLALGNDYNVGLELLPSTLSGKRGVNLCGKETSCLKTCLVFSGKGNLLMQKKMIEQGVITPVLGARAKRTWLYLNDTEFFFNLLDIELEKAKLTASVLGKKLAVRLNVFSDVDWSQTIVSHKDIQFYDYTKHWDRKSFKNYSITYSFSEKITDSQAIKTLKSGDNVAMVFHALPETWKGFKVVDGDVDDSRYSDLKGVVVGLKLKKTIGKTEENVRSKFLKVS